MSQRVAYFVNRYPAVSHSFIRREILALERKGVLVARFALRGWEGDLFDEDDRRERGITRYVLRGGLLLVLLAAIRTAVLSPRLFLRGLMLAIRMGIHADRPMAYHIGYLAEACRMLPWVRSFGAQHVHAHFGTNSAEIVMLMRALGGPPYSFTVHGPDEFDMPVFLGLKEKVNRAAFVVAITSYTRSQLYRWVDHSQWPKVRVIRCGLEASFFEIPAPPPPDVKRLVCIGRLVEQKGQLLLIEAAKRLLQKGIRFKLVLVGGGPMHSQLAALVREFELDDCVELPGAVTTDRLRGELQLARGLVLPSFAEGLPMVIMEAMALRRPVLSTYIAGIPELVKHGENGWLIPAGSVTALESAMEELLLLPVADLARYGEAARASAIALHSAEQQARELADMFRESCASQP